LPTRSTLCGGVFDLDAKRAQIAKLEEQSADPAIWGDQQAAKVVMRELSDLREQVSTWDKLQQDVAETRELLEMATEAEDESILAEVNTETENLRKRYDQLEFHLALGGRYDRSDAILTIHAGAGGTEAQDWASMLLRMFLRWAENKRYDTEITDQLEGEEAGIKTTTVEIHGPWAYGYLKSERGVHRLVRISPFDGSARRHTSFALVEVVPVLDDDIEIDIRPEDVKMDVYRSGGAGGQHMQKNSTAVRLTHLPSGIVVTCQNERSQLQNRESAMHVLRGKLYDIELQKLETEQARLRGKHVDAGWGNQIRSYVLHPYQMVKDLRTEVETSDTGGVLDGDLDAFMEAWLKDQVGTRDGDGAK
jgi:peptide chain release factor 2